MNEIYDVKSPIKKKILQRNYKKDYIVVDKLHKDKITIFLPKKKDGCCTNKCFEKALLEKKHLMT